MSHQTGIVVADGLMASFSSASSSGSKRAIVASIEEDTIVESGSVAPKSDDWKDDLDLVPPLLKIDQAAYVLFRTDRGWLLMAYVPDKCKVKQKMVYAATRATLKKDLGSMNFVDEIHGTLPEDFGRKGYDQWKTMKDAEAPLTRAEITKQEELENNEIYRGGASSYVHGVSFPADDNIIPALKKMVTAGEPNYVALNIDVDKEKIQLLGTKHLTIGDIGKEVSLTEPRFHFFRYKHDVRGTYFDETVFIYTCPDGSGQTKACPIKLRMLYSASKARVAELLENAGGKVAKTFEFNEPSDVTADVLDNLLHPPEGVQNNFTKARPAPPGKGARKLLR